MDSRHRPTLDHLRQRTPVRIAHKRRWTWRTAGDQAVGAMRIEACHPVPDDLQAHTANPGSIAARATLIDGRQSQEPPSLTQV